jgi:hypothetical protein
MKKYCDYYFTIKHVETAERNNHTPLKKYAWFIREKNGTQILSSLDEDCEFEHLYDDPIEAEINCREAISDHYY